MSFEKDHHTGNQENSDTNFKNQHDNLFRGERDDQRERM